MKNIFLLILVAALALGACKKETLDVSQTTTYVTLKMKSSPTLFWSLNTPFVDPGCTAIEGTNDLTDKIIVTSDVDVEKGGKYTLTYKVQNSDGFYSQQIRTVYVCDQTAPLNGYYESNIKRDNAGTIANRGPFTLMVYGIGNDNYIVSDLMGGWYEFGSSYGPAYASSAVLKLNGDNTFSIVSASVTGFGSSCVLTAGTTSTYDAATKKLVLNTNMEASPAMKFTVTLSNPSSLN